jgi:hypothetical protein
LTVSVISSSVADEVSEEEEEAEAAIFIFFFLLFLGSLLLSDYLRFQVSLLITVCAPEVFDAVAH